MTISKKILIIGSDGLIGNALKKHLIFQEKPVLGTTRHKNHLNKTTIFFDLFHSPQTWKIPINIDIAVICAGETRLMSCKNDPVGTYEINVTNTFELIKKLLSQNIFVIYLSSNQVFDGSQAYAPIDSPYSPMTEYGRQKAEIEQRIMEMKQPFSIIRLTKVLSSKDNLINNWKELLTKGKEINPFKDLYMSPIPLSIVLTVINIVIQQKISGVLQISGNMDINYVDIARLCAKILNCNKRLIKPINSSKIKLEHIPKHTTLDIDKLQFLIGIRPPNVLWTTEMVITNPHVIDGCIGEKGFSAIK